MQQLLYWYWWSIDQYTPSVFIVLEEYGVDNVTVALEWTQQMQAGDTVPYNVSISPLVPIIFNGSTSLKLALEYNLEYNLSVEADVHCESNATAFVTLYYGGIFMLPGNMY